MSNHINNHIMYLNYNKVVIIIVIHYLQLCILIYRQCCLTERIEIRQIVITVEDFPEVQCQ